MFKNEPVRMRANRTISAPISQTNSSSTSSTPSTPYEIGASNIGYLTTSSAPNTPPIIDNKKGYEFSISHIQQIQEEIVSLIEKIENFSNHAKSSEYNYLDEMLTRNLIQLDAVDTLGNLNIRLAKKEAIKCIEQAIIVLEEKATYYKEDSI